MIKAKLSSLSAKQLYLFQRGYHLGSIILIWSMAAIIFKLLDLEQTKRVALLSIFFFVLSLVIMVSVFSISKIVNEIAHTNLLEALDLQKYQEFNHYRHNGQFKILKKHEQYANYLNDGQVAYLRGEFSKSLPLLESINASKIVWYMRDNYSLTKDFYTILNHLYLGETDKADELLADFVANHPEHRLAKEATAINDIVNGRENAYFDDLEVKYRFGAMSKAYYSALNALIKGKKEEAKTKFASIANLPDDFFYVQEAKNYLENLK